LQGRAIDFTISLDDEDHQDDEARLQEAEEAFAALQVLDDRDKEKKETSDQDKLEDELLRSLEDIEPQQFTAISDIADDNDSLALLSSDILDLLSNDNNPDGVSVVSEDNDETNQIDQEPNTESAIQNQEEPPSNLPHSMKETLIDSTQNSTQNSTTTANTTLVADSLPEIEIDFGDDPFLINSDQLHSIFDVDDDRDNESREENDVGSLDEEGRRDTIDNKLVAIGEENDKAQHEGTINDDNDNDDEDLLLQHPVVEEFPVDVDLDTEELYSELAKMSLTEQNATINATFQGVTDENKSANTNDPKMAAPKNPEKPKRTKAERKKAAMDLLLADDPFVAMVTESPKKVEPSKAERKKAALALLLGEDDPLVSEEKKAALDLLLGNDAVVAESPKKEEPTKADKKQAALDLLVANDPMGADYLMCQPCSQDDYNTIAGSQAVAEAAAVERDREQHMRDLKALYAVSALNPDDLPPLDYSDPLVRELQAQYEYEQYMAQRMHYEQQQQMLAERMEFERKQQEEYDRTWNNAKHWAKAFAIDLDSENHVEENKPAKNTATSGFGHKETIFGISFSPDGKYVATACQDATVGIWDVARNRLVTSLKGHNKKYECLRVDWASALWAHELLDRSTSFSNVIASAGADGSVKVWSCPEIGNEWTCEYTLEHANLSSMKKEEGLDKIVEEEEEKEEEVELDALGEPKEKGDKPQVYALQFIDHWDIFTKNLKDQVCSRHTEQVKKQEEEDKEVEKVQNSFLMTSSDEFIHLWELESHSMDNQLALNGEKIRILQDKIKLKEVMSLHFGPLEEYTYGVTVCSVTGTGMKLPPPPSKTNDQEKAEGAFGGERNPDGTIFVFDAAYSPGSGLLGVALSDGSLRLVNGRGFCISVIQVPGSKSHLTSFCWDTSGSRLATCVATGHLITWQLDAESHDRGNYNTVATCVAIFEGGHQSGRPLFGSRYCGGENENLLLSWGVDGKICMWYSQSQGNIYDPVAVLREDSNYPIYAAALSGSEEDLVVGGGSDGGFIGVPLHFYNIPPLEEGKPKATEE